MERAFKGESLPERGRIAIRTAIAIEIVNPSLSSYPDSQTPSTFQKCPL
jgi:hypothetical protein